MSALCPCRGCPRRTVGCHIDCWCYRVWKLDREAERARRLMRQEAQADVDACVMQGRKRRERRRRNGG